MKGVKTVNYTMFSAMFRETECTNTENGYKNKTVGVGPEHSVQFTV